MNARYPILFILTALLILSAPLRAQPVQFTRLSENVDGATAMVTQREEARYERFLAAVFPTWPMRRFAHTNEKPIVRRVTYSVVEQHRQKFIVAVFSGRWQEAYNVIGIYRINRGPIQMWRSAPWEATYYDLHMTTAGVGPRTLVLFQEGGQDRNFGLGSVFSFTNIRSGVWIKDLTPTNSIVTARTRFPFRPILAQDLQLTSQSGDEPWLLLSASDQEYVLASNQRIRPTEQWRFDRIRNRFESIRSAKTTGVTTYRSANE